MPLRIVDEHGNEGQIDEDLAMAYAGPDEIAQQIETLLTELNADGLTTEEQFKQLVVELPGQSRIQSIERVGDGF